MDTIVRKIKKVQELAKRGVDGEAKAAQLILEKMLSQYGLTMESLNDTELKTKWFRFNNPYERQLILHCASKVKDDPELRITTSPSHPDRVFIEMWEWQYTEMVALLKIHKPELNAKMEALFEAYLNKHDLFAQSSEAIEGKDITEIVNAYKSL